MALTARSVSYTYGLGSEFQQHAVDSVDLVVEAGAGPTLIAGRTGSGKSTLLRLLSGLQSPDSGDVDVDGSPASLGGAVDTGIGLVFQSPEGQLFAETVLDDVMFGPRNQGRRPEESRALAVRALARMGLDADEFGGRSPFTLSGGEARRAAIAGVVAMEPRYLLLDEPLAGLDADGRALILDVISEVSVETGIAVVSHDIEELLPICSNVLLLDGGHTVYSGSTGGLLSDPTRLERAGLAVPPLVQVWAAARDAGVDLVGHSPSPRGIADAIAQHQGVGR